MRFSSLIFKTRVCYLGLQKYNYLIELIGNIEILYEKLTKHSSKYEY